MKFVMMMILIMMKIMMKMLTMLTMLTMMPARNLIDINLWPQLVSQNNLI